MLASVRICLCPSMCLHLSPSAAAFTSPSMCLHLPPSAARCQCAHFLSRSMCLQLSPSTARSPGRMLASVRISLSFNMCLRLSPSAARFRAACLPVCALTCLPGCAFFVSQRCQIAGPCQWATCSPVCAFICLPARAFICPPVLPDRRAERNARKSASAVGRKSVHKRLHCRRARVFLVGAKNVSNVGAQECFSLAHKRGHCRRIKVPVVGAQVCLLSAHKSVPCWNIIVSSVCARKCSLLPRKRGHRRRAKVFLASSHAHPLLARKSARCWRTHCSRTKVFMIGEQACSSANKSVHYRRATVPIVVFSRSRRAKVFFAGACAVCRPG